MMQLRTLHLRAVLLTPPAAVLLCQVAAVCDRPWSSKLKSAREHADAALRITSGARWLSSVQPKC